MASIKEELESDDEDTETTSRSKSIRLPEFRRANTIDYVYWKKVEDDLRLEGRKFRTGQFSHEENRQLTKNWQTLIKKCTLKEPEILLRTNVCPEMKNYVKEFKINNNFHVRLGHRINRSPYAVYLRARKMFNIVEKTGKFTPEEESNLKSLETKLGRKWEQIGRVMGRSGHATFKKAEALKKEVVKGRWSKEEDGQLMEAVANYMKKRKTKTTLSENKFFKLPWKEISKHVPTRNAKQCRERCLLVHEQNGENGDSKPKRLRFKKVDKLKLVEEITATKMTDECDIDWTLIHKKFPWIRCPQLLHYQWYRVKKSVPNYHYNSLKENLAGVIKILSNDLVIGDDSDDDDDMDFNESTLLELKGLATKRVEAKNEMSSDDSLALQSHDVFQIDTPNLSATSKKERKRQRSVSSDVVEAETSEINESLNGSNTLQPGAVSSDETPVKEKKHKKKKRRSSANSDAVDGEETQISPEKHSSSEVEASGGNRKHKKKKRQSSANSDAMEGEETQISPEKHSSSEVEASDGNRKHKKKKRQSSANSDAVEGEETQISPEKHSSSEVEASGGNKKHKKKKKDREISLDTDRADIEKVEEISKSVEQQPVEKNLSFTSPEAKTPKKKKKRSSKELTPTAETETSTNKEKKKHKDADEQESDLSGILERSVESNVETSEEFKTPKVSKKKKRSLDDSPQSQSENISQEEVPRKEPKRKKRKLSNTPLSTLDDF